MQRLTALSLSHFRSHLLSRLAFDGRPVAIHGPNGAGKTNLIEAISLLSPGRGLRRAGLGELTRRPEALGWKLRATVTGAGAVHDVELWAEAGGPRQTRIDGKAAPQLALGRIMRVLWLVPSMDRLWAEGAEGRRRFLDRLTMSIEPGHGEAVLAYERALRERNRLLRDDVHDPRWFEAVEMQMAGAGATLAANRRMARDRLTEAQIGASTTFPVADLALAGPDGMAEPDWSVGGLAEALAASRRADLRAGRSLTGPHRADLLATWATKGVPAAQCSTGEQKALLISLVLANARALKHSSGEAPLLLLDEVAAHLDATRRGALYEEILALEAQAFLTGTGPDLFAEFGDRAQYLQVIEGADGSELMGQGLTPVDGNQAVRPGSALPQ